MSTQFITPIIPTISVLEGNSTTKVGKLEGDSLFTSVFQNAIKNVTDSENELAGQEFLLATGQIDDAHTVPIAAAKAQLSVDLLVQLRNKALEAYKEIVNINI